MLDYSVNYNPHSTVIPWLAKQSLSLYTRQVANQDRAYPGFCSMWLGVYLLPPDGMLVHLSIIPSIKFADTHFSIHPGGAENYESWVFYPRTQCNDLYQGSTLDCSGDKRTKATAPPTMTSDLVLWCDSQPKSNLTYRLTLSQSHLSQCAHPSTLSNATCIAWNYPSKKTKS